MSEYQYYEFAAIDRPLTRTEMAEPRAVSTRAGITPGGFTNHYEWGDLKTDPAEWMRRYFDAFVYSANWCSCHVSLRLPKAVFRKGELDAFARSAALSIESSDSHWIVSWTLEESEDYDRFAEDDGSGWMCRLIPLRDELMHGDLRPLYQKRDGELRRIMDSRDKYWKAASEQAYRGSSSGYEKTVSLLGNQGWQKRLLPCLCERVASRCLRKAPHQMQ